MFLNIRRRAAAVFAIMLLFLLVSACTGQRDPQDQGPADNIRQQGRVEPRSDRKESTEESDEEGKRDEKQVKKPDLPRAIAVGQDQEPSLKVYIVQDQQVKDMPFEEYVAGVVGNQNDWAGPLRLRLTARTFVPNRSVKGHSNTKMHMYPLILKHKPGMPRLSMIGSAGMEQTRLSYTRASRPTWFHSTQAQTATPKKA